MSNDYFSHSKAIGRIDQVYPNAKYILCLRNPADRLISHFYQDIKTGKIQKDSKIKDAISNDDKMINIGNYRDHFNAFDQYIKPERLLVVFFDDLSKNPNRVISELSKFLNLEADSFDTKSIRSKRNIRRIPKSRKLEQFQNNIYHGLQNYTWGKYAYKFAKRIGLGDIMRKINSDKGSSLKLDQKTKNHLQLMYQVHIDYVKHRFNRQDLNW